MQLIGMTEQRRSILDRDVGEQNRLMSQQQGFPSGDCSPVREF